MEKTCSTKDLEFLEHFVYQWFSTSDWPQLSRKKIRLIVLSEESL